MMHPEEEPACLDFRKSQLRYLAAGVPSKKPSLVWPGEWRVGARMKTKSGFHLTGFTRET